MFDLGKQYSSRRTSNVQESNIYYNYRICNRPKKSIAAEREHTQTIREQVSSSRRSQTNNMLYYSIDPQFATLLCSVYSRNDRFGLSVLPETFCYTASTPSAGSILSYAHTVGLQIIALGEQYAKLLGQVRTGSVIFLVGVGSLVCWKLWEYWKHGGGVDPSGPGNLSPSLKSPRERTKGKGERTKEFLASFLEEEFVHDIDLEDDDPALIQGRYFGPDSPVEARIGFESSPLTSKSSAKSRSETANHYLADNSSSFSIDDDVGFQTSDFEHDSLPFDDLGVTSAPQSPLCAAKSSLRRSKKRQRHPHDLARSLSSSPAHSPIPARKNLSGDQKEIRKLNIHPKRLYPYRRSLSVCEDDFSSSETSPRSLPPYIEKRARASLPPSRVNVGCRRDGDGSETQDSGKVTEQRIPREFQYANYNSDEDWSNDARAQPDGEEEMERQNGRRLSREISLGDLMERLRQRSNQRRGSASMSRDNSVSSHLSDFLRRDGSICSNLSEYCGSECSEFSLELSYKDEVIANQTITSLADIEDELNTLKSSVHEIDEEFVRFASRPNPYLFKTTFSDYSFDSDSRPDSALGVVSYRLTRTRVRLNSERDQGQLDESVLDSESNPSVEPTPDREIKGNLRSQTEAVDFDLSSSVDSTTCDVINMNTLDDMARDIRGRCAKELEASRAMDERRRSSLKSAKGIKRFRNRLLSTGSLPRSMTQEELLLSLEWDNDCLTQYDEESGDDDVDENGQLKGSAKDSNQEIEEMEGFEKYREEFRRSTFLPDHSSLELDLEEELQATPSDSQSIFRGREAIATALGHSLRYSQSLSIEPTNMAEEELDYSLPPYSSLSSKSLDEAFRKPVPPNSLPLREKTSDAIYNPMTVSVDSAIHSASGSRSGSCSPLPQQLTQSTTSSGLGASWSETSSELTPDLESASITASAFDKPSYGVAEYRRKLRKFWSSEESGYAEGDEVEPSITNLSPVHEIRERDSSGQLISDIEEENLNNNNSFLHQNQRLHLEGNLFLPINENNENLNNNQMGNNSSRLSDVSGSSSTSGFLHRQLKPVGEKIDIITYAHQEWMGNTAKAQTIRNGYSAIPNDLELQYLRQIRGDNYCGIRAVLFQLLTTGLPVPCGYQVYNRLVSELNNGSTWLKEYSFGRRLHYSKDQVMKGLKECLDTLDKVSLDLISCENKETALISMLNDHDLMDPMLCEAAKLHMLASALDLHRDDLLGSHVPLFGMIMYARQSCSNPQEFLNNHLNAVGDSAGLEQDPDKIEMFLLGYALRVTIQVVRPFCYGNEDFICFYPDENIGDWPEVTLVAEDDRHYNVLVK